MKRIVNVVVLVFMCTFLSLSLIPVGGVQAAENNMVATDGSQYELNESENVESFESVSTSTTVSLNSPQFWIRTQDSSATLNWKAVEGATEYKIFRYKPYYGTYQYIGTTTDLSYEITGLTNGKKYGYIVRAKNDCCVSSMVKWKVKYTIPVTQPSITAKTSTSTAKLSWNSVAGAKGYRIFQWDTNTSSWKKVAQTTALKYNVTGLTNGKESKFIVRAFTGYGMSQFKESDTDTVIPLAYPKFTITAKDSAASLSWKAVAGATEYKIFRYKPYYNKYVLVGTTTELSYDVTGLTNGKSYGYIVRAKNADGASNLAKWKVQYVTPKEVPYFEETVVYNENDILIKAVSIKNNGYYGPEVRFYIQNNSTYDLDIYADDVSVNGYTIFWGVDFYPSVLAGGSIYETMYLDQADMELNGIDKIELLEFELWFDDYDRGRTLFVSDPITLTTSLYDPDKVITAPDGELVYDANGIKVWYTGVDTDGSYYGGLWGPEMQFYIENESDTTVMVFASEEASVNGNVCYADYIWQVTTGHSTNTVMTFYDDDFDPIESIETAEFSLIFLDYDTIDILFESDVITLNTTSD